MLKLVLVATLLIQDGGLWRMGETKKDPMTDQPVTVAVLGMLDHYGALYVGRNGKTESVWVLYYGPRLEVQDIAVTYRVDDGLPVEEVWEVEGRRILTRHNHKLIKSLLAGSRLRIQIADTETGTMDFKIQGLHHFAAQLGLKVD